MILLMMKLFFLFFHPDHRAIFLGFQTKDDVFKLGLPKNVTGKLSLPSFYRVIYLIAQMPSLFYAIIVLFGIDTP